MSDPDEAKSVPDAVRPSPPLPRRGRVVGHEFVAGETVGPLACACRLTLDSAITAADQGEDLVCPLWRQAQLDRGLDAAAIQQLVDDATGVVS